MRKSSPSGPLAPPAKTSRRKTSSQAATSAAAVPTRQSSQTSPPTHLTPCPTSPPAPPLGREGRAVRKGELAGGETSPPTPSPTGRGALWPGFATGGKVGLAEAIVGARPV